MKRFTAQEVIEVYLKRWALAEIGKSLIELLRPECVVIQKVREYVSKFDNNIQ